MKKLAALTFLLMFIVACGGGSDGPSTDKPPVVKQNVLVFETPPTPGSNR
jgi:hypothetical protein